MMHARFKDDMDESANAILARLKEGDLVEFDKVAPRIDTRINNFMRNFLRFLRFDQ